MWWREWTPDLPDSLSPLPPTPQQKASLCSLNAGAMNGAFIPATFLSVLQTSLSAMVLTSTYKIIKQKAWKEFLKWSAPTSFFSFLFLFCNRKKVKEDRKVKRLVQDKAVGWPQNRSAKTLQIIFFTILSCLHSYGKDNGHTVPLSDKWFSPVYQSRKSLELEFRVPLQSPVPLHTLSLGWGLL